MAGQAPLEVLWHSEDGQNNAVALRVNDPNLFRALEEVDRLGHRQLTRFGAFPITDMNRLVGAVLLRRGVTLFVGLRHLVEASVVEVAKLPLRALFEVTIAFRYLAYGGRKKLDFGTPSNARRREARARYFYVAAQRRKLYARKGVLDGKWGPRPMDRVQREAIKNEFNEMLDDLNTRFPTQMDRFGPLRCMARKGRRQYHDSREWFSFGFHGGKVSSLHALARRLGLANEYQLVYGPTSGLMHPQGISHDIEITDQGAEVLHPYMAEAAGFVTAWGCMFQLYVIIWATKVYQRDTLADAQATHRRVMALLYGVDRTIPVGLF